MTLDKVPVCLICVWHYNRVSDRGLAQSVWCIARFVFVCVCVSANTHTHLNKAPPPFFSSCKEQGENQLKNCCTRLYRLNYLYFVVTSHRRHHRHHRHHLHLFLIPGVKCVKSQRINSRNSINTWNVWWFILTNDIHLLCSSLVISQWRENVLTSLEID